MTVLSDSETNASKLGSIEMRTRPFTVIPLSQETSWFPSCLRISYILHVDAAYLPIEPGVDRHADV